MKLRLKQLSNLKGSAKLPLLDPEAADSLLSLERDTDGLIYLDIWRDGIASLVAKRMSRTSHLPSYSAHNYGLAIDIDVTSILNQKKIRYEDLLHLMKRRGWYCHRRDGDSNKTNSGHFNYLGQEAERYLVKCSLDPITWGNPAELMIYERYGMQFPMSLKEAQEKLARLGMFKGKTTGTNDIYTREAVLAFQRAWNLIENGYVDDSFCRVLAFITAEIQII